MRTFKSVFGIIGALIPVLYCVGLLVYFVGVERWTGVPVGNALGPTILGLGVVGLLFSIPLVLRIRKLFVQPAQSKVEIQRTAQVFADEPSQFDPDAAIARYMAKRGQAEASVSPSDEPPPRPSFGRKRT